MGGAKDCFSSAFTGCGCGTVTLGGSIGVILTGMGYDGAKGLLKIKQRGGVTVGEDEHSSIVYGMPKVAYDIGAVDKQADLKNIPQVIYSLL